jgi:hypothetical protein
VGEGGVPRILRSALAAATFAATAPLAAPPAAEAGQLDPQRFEEVLAAARHYAADRTLINYCLRRNSEEVPFLYSALHGDIQDGLEKLRAAGADGRQIALFVQAVLSNVTFAAPDADDPALDVQCAVQDVEKNVYILMGVGAPIILRAPFAGLAP